MGLGSKHVSGDGHAWSQGVFKDERALEVATKGTQSQQQQQRQQRLTTLQQANPPLSCPRCDSHNTKFCYYNNYSRSQPRHFCKACRRHWTNGGTLRNVPVGGGRKNKRQKTSHNPAITTSNAAAITEDNTQQQQQLQLPLTFVTPADMLCQQGVLLQPASTSSPSDYLSNSSSSSNSTSILASLLSLPPIPPLASGLLTDYDVAAGCDPPFPFFPFTRQLEDQLIQEESKMAVNIVPTNSLVGASGVGLYHSHLFPGFGLQANGANVMMEPSHTTTSIGGGGGYWWDGFVPQDDSNRQ